MFHLPNVLAGIGILSLGVLIGAISTRKQRDSAQQALNEMHKIMKMILESHTKVQTTFDAFIKSKDETIKALKKENRHLTETCEDLETAIQGEDEDEEDESDEGDDRVYSENGETKGVPVAVGAPLSSAIAKAIDKTPELFPESSVASVAMELFDKVSAARTQLETMADRMSPHDLELLRNTLNVTEKN